MSFVHLHTYSDYSCLQSLASIQKLIAKCQLYGLPGLALTDVGNLYGGMEFFEAAQGAGMNAIIGSTFYLRTADAAYAKPHAENAPFREWYNLRLSMPKHVYKIVLLAETMEGYRELIKLSTLSFHQLDHEYPIVTLEDLYRHRKGLIAFSGGPESEVYEAIRRGDSRERLFELGHPLREIFGENQFYLFIEDHQLSDQARITSELFALSEKLGAPLMAANQTCYVEQEDAYSHEIMLSIAGKHLISAKKGFNIGERPYLEGTGYHFKSGAEMGASFESHPELLTRTLEINDRCQINIREKDFHMPKFPLLKGESGEEMLRRRVYAGLNALFQSNSEEDEQLAVPVVPGEKVFPELYEDRIKRELDVICEMGFAEYFLIVADMIEAARKRDILVGPGRGSVVGSLVAYALQITDIDPLHYDLLFERFLTKGRVSMPDIDIDIQDDRRDEIIEYLRQTYGEKNSCLIITYAKLRAKAVFKDVARVFNVDFNTANELSDLIDIRVMAQNDNTEDTGDVERTLLRATYERVNEFKQQIHGSEKLSKVYQHSLRLENLTRQTGIHAAGVVIADRELVSYIPLMRSKKDGEMITISQYDGKYLEQNCGLLKMDVLGLRTLNLIKDAVSQIETEEGIKLNWSDPPLSDKKSFQLFAQGMTMGIFQFESEGMTRYLRELRPDNVDELIAMNALYRPGPMAWIPVYIARKNDPRKLKQEGFFASEEDRIKYNRLEELCKKSELLKEVLRPTRYIPIYQEQIMQISRVFAGFSLEEADQIRAAMGKKKKSLIASLRKQFIDGAKQLNHSETEAIFLYDGIIEAFGGYGFNKSHAAAYALLAYRMAYIKANYSNYFMAAFLNSVITDLSERKMRRIFEECERMHVTIAPPSIQTSMALFTVQGKTILFGLCALKGVSKTVARAIVEERTRGGLFSGLSEFLKRMSRASERQANHATDRFLINKQVVEALVKAQCFDELYTGFPPETGAATRSSSEVSGDTTESSVNAENVPKGGLRANHLLAILPQLQKIVDTEQHLFSGGQQSLFGSAVPGEADSALSAQNKDPHDKDWALEEKCLRSLSLESSTGETGTSETATLRELERSALGFNFREDSTLKHLKLFMKYTDFPVEASQSWQEGKNFTLAGILDAVDERLTKRTQEEMCIFHINTGTRILEAVCFPGTWKRIKAQAARLSDRLPSARARAKAYNEALVLDAPILISGVFRKNNNNRMRELFSLVVNDIRSLQGAALAMQKKESIMNGSSAEDGGHSDASGETSSIENTSSIDMASPSSISSSMPSPIASASNEETSRKSVSHSSSVEISAGGVSSATATMTSPSAPSKEESQQLPGKNPGTSATHSPHGKNLLIVMNGPIGETEESVLKSIHEVLLRSTRGGCQIYLQLSLQAGAQKIFLGEELAIEPTERVLVQLRQIENVREARLEERSRV